MEILKALVPGGFICMAFIAYWLVELRPYFFESITFNDIGNSKGIVCTVIAWLFVILSVNSIVFCVKELL